MLFMCILHAYFINFTSVAALGSSKETALVLVSQEKNPKIEDPENRLFVFLSEVWAIF